MNEFVIKHRLSTFIAAYVAVFLFLASLGTYIIHKSGILSHNTTGGTNAASHNFSTDLSYYDLPRMTISASGGDGGGGASAPRVRLDMSLEVASKDVEVLDGYQPRITDRLNRFLSSLKPEQINQSSIPWLREQILKQINSAGSPVPVHDVVFRQLVVM